MNDAWHFADLKSSCNEWLITSLDSLRMLSFIKKKFFNVWAFYADYDSGVRKVLHVFFEIYYSRRW